MHILVWILLSSLITSLMSLIGIFFITLKERTLDKIILGLVAFSAGTLMGGAFIHLFPEGYEAIGGKTFSLIFLCSFSLFFIVERILHWHHCHEKDCPVHTVGYMNLIGDSIHNFTDGLILAATYLTNIHLGVITTIAVISHEIPQEIGDFSVLLYSGFSKKKALLYNFGVSLTAVIGALVGYYIPNQVDIAPYLLPIAAGSFVYISASDLIPEIHKEKNLSRSVFSFLLFLLGILLMYGITFI